MSGEAIYRKVGRRYVKIGIEFSGFPANGVWLVEDGRMSRIMKVGDLQDPMPLSKMQRGQPKACKALRELIESCVTYLPSYSDQVDAVLMAVAKQLQEDEHDTVDRSSLRNGSWCPPARGG